MPRNRWSPSLSTRDLSCLDFGTPGCDDYMCTFEHLRKHENAYLGSYSYSLCLRISRIQPVSLASCMSLKPLISSDSLLNENFNFLDVGIVSRGCNLEIINLLDATRLLFLKHCSELGMVHWCSWSESQSFQPECCFLAS